ncbi:SDR family NAD(P)-dependent oxidoreductase [Sporosarcina sp. P17b]|uniref:SDR family NAD(P)-dependent oxidoreductase n=1 Tax=Sporosarcina sp. P17b TaxID=2048260 RepID=UPI000C16C469|nr:glucose 1-dehydrogenase [Sporosarcina sp. P17b]PIC72909.1 short chain dehydrogenase [Sporosarcina sp. P17b]
MAGMMVGKAGLVTGSGSGIGRASALALAKAGAKVMVSDVSEEAGQETVQMIKDLGGEAAFIACDVSNEEQVIALVDKTVETFDQLDFALNNAGINKGQKPIGELDSKDWDLTLKVNLYGTFYCIKHEVNAMLKTGGGAIVNTASGAGLEGSPNMTPYTASKHAIAGLTKSVALEYGQQGITINSIAPGATITPAIEGWAKTSPEQYEAVLASLPAGRMSTAEDQANAVVFLCSDLARSISGVTLAVDGGYTAGKMQS